MNFKVPTRLETERLILRMFAEEDWRDLHPYYADEACMRYTIGRVLTEGETWRTMAGMIGHWQLRGYGPYAVEEKATSRVIGVCAVWYPYDWPETESKWGLVPDAWGRGYATEGAAAVRDMAFSSIENCKIISLIISDNVNSIKVAKAIGASFEKEITFRGSICHIYRHQNITPRP